MPITLNWTDTNDKEDGHRVYRSTSAIDPAALPTPLADLGADVTTYTDGDVTEGETYYYRVSAYRGTSENVSEELVMVALPEADAYVASVGVYANEPKNVSERVLQIPPETGVGDLLVAFIAADTNDAAGVGGPPPGWYLVSRNSGTGVQAVFTKTADSDDIGGIALFDVFSGVYSAGQILALRGAAALSVSQWESYSSSSFGPWDIPQITFTARNTLVLSAAFFDDVTEDTRNVEYPLEWNTVSPVATDVFTPLGVFWRKYTDPGSVTGEFNISGSVSADLDPNAITLAIGRAP